MQDTVLGDAEVTLNHVKYLLKTENKECGEQRKVYLKNVFGIHKFLLKINNNTSLHALKSINTFTYINDIWLPESLPGTGILIHSNKGKSRHELSAHKLNLFH